MGLVDAGDVTYARWLVGRRCDKTVHLRNVPWPEGLSVSTDRTGTIDAGTRRLRGKRCRYCYRDTDRRPKSILLPRVNS